MIRNHKKRSVKIYYACIYDGGIPVGICMSNECRGFICFNCFQLIHSNHLNNTFTFDEIKVKVEIVISQIKEIAIQFSLGGREDYSEHLEKFTQNFWQLELEYNWYKSKKLQKEVVLLQSIPRLREINKQLTLSKENHAYYFYSLKPLLFVHSNNSRNYTEEVCFAIKFIIIFLLCCALIIIILKFILIKVVQDG
ncbi:unnamed protein product [Paramecium octaurelia]|uniref:Uncharacterized protein n=1 Tax=Paramecium octaurelia TaxID=43137 RepID=A0A8S1WUM9_PAROT|nr:unnamed protein product [Paramecium octaurelia]